MFNADELIEARETPAYQDSQYVRPYSKLSDEDMLIRGIEDSRYTPFGNSD